jgi:hypothetical protein
MWFKKKKDVDLRELQRKGLIRVPKQEVELETDRNGFVDLSSNTTTNETTSTKDATEPSPFNFFDNPSSTIPNQQQNKDNLEATRRLEELDNKIYKLEQRIELLERKAGVGSSSEYSW